MPVQPSFSVHRSSVTIAAIILILLSFKLASDIVIPILLAFFIAVLCNPTVDFLERFNRKAVKGPLSLTS
ncbi:hypothetical protein M3P05_13935 [Sansalvadorimonas sp. 2012CJ34-2]|uniref:AI-2E family transporter n=1 Tax=Parendozoicomonas callyspongiae TaxID=2942213 RepID=A0ABT0PJZ1_9GAMM|nr:hypothetical protein [Sansalvadorimonas sp. 2012CJ34-2]MCL6271027.1 hypothetical protein [Sansalvadorimonas sp. 2012CJ34-2]